MIKISLFKVLRSLSVCLFVFTSSAGANQPATYYYVGDTWPYAYHRIQELTPDAVCSKLTAVFNKFLEPQNPKPVGYPFDYRVVKTSPWSPLDYRCISPSSYPDTDYRFIVYAQSVCPVGEAGLTPYTCTSSPITDTKSIPDPTPPVGGCSAAVTTANPIAFVGGNKVLRETDYLSYGTYPLFKRTYNSSSIVGNSSSIVVIDNQGQKWRNTLSRSVQVINGVAYTYRAGGKIYSFNPVTSSWLPDADIPDKLTEVKDAGSNRTGWVYYDSVTENSESYDATGKLLSITDRAGVTQSLTYDASN